jgi:hypothetical protein
MNCKCIKNTWYSRQYSYITIGSIYEYEIEYAIAGIIYYNLREPNSKATGIWRIPKEEFNENFIILNRDKKLERILQ